MVRPQPRREVLKSLASGTVFGESIIKGGAIDVRNYQNWWQTIPRKQGETLQVEKLNAEVGAEVVFEEVLTVVNDADVKIGKPVVEGAKVVAKLLNTAKQTRFSFSNTKLNPTTVNVKVIVNRSLLLKSPLLTHNFYGKC